ncbi:hypothetical protein [Noviherbaspirillum aridicola]|uniref:Uncharacterized protein n=1 Tax=Noviherbaspirillum aridicola TaxID=2849687 RepID=A0ABQ4QBQ1_9BURK|nr:hypothetical protein [Noviherbaspirillum aridicola]GIZ54109.1 hypothetical protein NCCP691_41230 [Noviherbaspirillum aridicola]
MPASSDEKLDAADLPEISISGGSVPPSCDDEDMQIPAPSEIATRINLLGKLVIPRTPR